MQNFYGKSNTSISTLKILTRTVDYRETESDSFRIMKIF